MCIFIFSFLNSLYLLLHQDEKMSALDQLRGRTSKKEGKMKKTNIEKEREPHAITEDVFRTTKAIYIELLA
jgi:hypothetical protein